MNTGLRRAVLVALLAFCPCGVRAAAFEPGPRPAGAVFDPAVILGENVRAEISLPLEKIHQQEKVEVIAVVLTQIDDGTPEDAAGQMAAAWCESPFHALVLHVPGRDGSPWIVAGGDHILALNPDEVRDELALARRDASREPDDAAKLRTAATAAADLLRYWKGREATRLGVIDDMRAAIRLELETRARKQQILMLAAAAAAIPLIIGVVLAVRLLARGRRSTANKP